MQPRSSTMLVALSLAAGAAAPVSAQPVAPADDLLEEGALYSCRQARERVAVSFKPEVGLPELVTWAMGFSCKSFLYDRSLVGRSARVAIIAPEPMTPRQAWRLFLVALRAMNLTVVEKGAVLQIVEAPQARGEALPLRRGGKAVAGEEMARLILRPRFLDVTGAAAALTVLKSAAGEITALADAGVLLVTDRGEHIARMRELLDEIDQPVPGETLYAIAVRRRDAVELAETLRMLLGVGDAPPSPSGAARGAPARRPPPDASAPAPAQAAAAPSRIVADQRTNTIFVLGSELSYQRTRALAERIDIEGGDAEQVHMVELQYAAAEPLAATLSALVSAGGRTGGPPAAQVPAQVSAPTLAGEVRVTHDAATNAVLLVASTRDFLALRPIIDRLDAPRRQVYIEAVILELKADSGDRLGVSFHGGKPRGGGLALGGLQHAGLSSARPKEALAGTGLLGGVLGGPLAGAETLLGTTIPSFGVMVQSLAHSQSVDVLSSPHLLTADNQTARISVGENIPYKSGRADASPLVAATQPISRENVALTLEITPHVNAADIVRLDIELEISDVGQSDFGDSLGPTWTTRTIQNTVLVADQESVVLGGLLSERIEHIETRVPVLGSLPVLGHLFRYRERNRRKANLLVILTPHIVSDQLEAREAFDRRMRERSEFLESLDRFERMEYRPRLDHRRTRGLVDEIQRTVAEIEKERALRRTLEPRPRLPDGPVDPAPPPPQADGTPGLH